jgi:hypothetical protein
MRRNWVYYVSRNSCHKIEQNLVKIYFFNKEGKFNF